MQFEELGVPRVKVDRAVQYVDHNVVQLDNKNPDDHRMLQALARKHGLSFSRPGNGISHYIHMERYGKPGQTMLGADSHTTQGGCMGMIAIGAGGLDVAVALGGHPYEISCPEIVEVYLDGTLNRPWVGAKDIILELLRRLTASGGKNKVFEFTGPGTADLSIPERATIANMVADLGGTSGLFAPDEKTREWLERQGRAEDFVELGPDDGAEYDDRVEIDLGTLGPLVAKPHNPDNVVGVEEVAGTPVAQVCIGSSVNSGYADLALPGAVLADRGGQIVHPEISATATPGSRQILMAIAESGVYRQLSEGGVRMLEPVCGPCVGMGQAPPSDANSLTDLQPQLPRPLGHSRGLRVPVLAGGGRGVAAEREDRGSPRVRRRARARADARAAPVRRGRPHLPAGGRGRGGEDRDPARPQHQAPTGAHPDRDSLEARVATVQPDDISTGDLAPDGVEVMAYRSNVPAIAEFTLRHRDPEFRKRLKEWGSGIIVAGHNYGQGSSREHAALAPLHLGVEAVVAKSFARIHRRNLIAQGIAALTFADEADYEQAEVGQCWSFPELRKELEEASETISVKIDDGVELTLTHDMSLHERELLLAGGLLSYLREQEQPARP